RRGLRLVRAAFENAGLLFDHLLSGAVNAPPLRPRDGAERALYRLPIAPCVQPESDLAHRGDADGEAGVLLIEEEHRAGGGACEVSLRAVRGANPDGLAALEGEERGLLELEREGGSGTHWRHSRRWLDVG